MSLFAELKRRNVFRVAAAYLIIGWLVMQVGEVMAPALRLPDWILSALAFFLILGLPVVLFFAWAFELTPEGLKKEKDVDRSQSITHQTGQKLNRTIIFLFVLAAGYIAVDKMVLEPGQQAPPIAAVTAEPKAGAAGSGENAPGDNAPSEQSIAVLPFVNMSEDEANEYFSDGLSEELLNLLARIPQLHVAARTSSFQFKDQTGDIADIARKLKVAHVLEGSVRKAGDQVRITAQLIRADNGYHLWSETYDRTLDNIFQIQDEIAGAVVDALKVKLLGAVPAPREASPEAFALMLQGRYHMNQRQEEHYAKATEAFRQALEIDPDFAEAWAGLGQSLAYRAGFGYIDFDSGLAEARAAAQRAVDLNPDLAAGWAALGRLQLTFDWDWDAAQRSVETAMELEPGNVLVLIAAADAKSRLGMHADALRLWQQAVDHDPLNQGAINSLASAMEQVGQLEDAERMLRGLISLNPNYSTGHIGLAWVLNRQGRPEEALDEVEKEPEEGWRNLLKVIVLHDLGRDAESRTLLEDFIEKRSEFWSYQIAEMHAWRNEVDEAFEWLNAGFEKRDPGLSSLLNDTALYRLHDDPRWEVLLEKIGLIDYWHAMPAKYKGQLP